MSELELRQTTVAASAQHLLRTARGRMPRIGTLLALAFVLFLAAATVAPALVATQDPNLIAPTEAFEAPSAAHWFGTDESGRDIYSRIVAGTGTSLLIGVSATLIGLVLGLLLGLLASFGGRVVDFGVNRVVEVLFAFPGLLLALLVIVIAGPGPVTATIAVGLSTAPGYARIIRGQFVAIRSAPYVEAARVLGRSPARTSCPTHSCRCSCSPRSASVRRSSGPPRSVTSASARNRRRPSGVRCSRQAAPTSPPRGG